MTGRATSNRVQDIVADEIRRRCGDAFKMPDLMAWGIVKRLEEEGFSFRHRRVSRDEFRDALRKSSEGAADE